MKKLRSVTVDEKIERSNQILRAAILEFNEVGYEAATMTSISKRSGISRSLINFYFKDKKSLHKALEEKALIMLEEQLRISIEKVPDVLSKLKMALNCFIKFYEEQRGFYECLIRSDDEIDLDIELKDKSRALSAPVVAVIEAGVLDRKIINPYENAEVAAISIWCMAHGYATIMNSKHKILKTHWAIDSNNLKMAAESTIERIFAKHAPSKD